MESDSSTDPNHFEGEFQQAIESFLESCEQVDLAEHVRSWGHKIFEVFLSQQLQPSKSILKNFTEHIRDLEGLSEDKIVPELSQQFTHLVNKGEDLLSSLEDYEQLLEQVPVALNLERPSYTIFIQKGDSLRTRLRKLLRRPLVWFKDRHREVPTRHIAYSHLMVFSSEFSLQTVNNWYHLLGRLLTTCQRHIEQSHLEPEELRQALKTQSRDWLDALQQDFLMDFTNQAHRWLQSLEKTGTPEQHTLRTAKTRPEDRVQEAQKNGRELSRKWSEKFVYCLNRLKVSLHTSLLIKSLDSLVGEKFFHAIAESNTSMGQLVTDSLNFLKQLNDKQESAETLGVEQAQEMQQQLREFSKNNLKSELMSRHVRGSFRLLNREISLTLKRILPKEERVFAMSSDRSPINEVRHPDEIRIENIDLYELFEQSILINFLPLIEEKLEGVSNYLEHLFLEIEQVFQKLEKTFSQALENEDFDSQALSDRLQGQLEAQVLKISDLYQSLDKYIKDAESEAQSLLKDCQSEVKEGIQRLAVRQDSKQVKRKFEKLWTHFTQGLDNQKSKISQNLNALRPISVSEGERDIDKTLQRKMASRTLDTTTIRQFIKETYSFEHKLKDLPSVYGRLFSLEPIRDRRFFTAHQKKWTHFSPLVEAPNSRRSQRVLIIGDRGMGKTSLLNIAQVDIKTDILIRIEATDALSPIQSLCNHLKCKPQISSMLSALKQQQTAVIIDNFDHMVNKKSLHATEMLLEVIKQSGPSNHWILSLTRNNYYPLDQAFRIGSWFNKLIDLHEISAQVGQETLLSRHRLSGLSLTYPRGAVREWSSKLGLATSEEMFFRVLFERSHGHLRHLIYLWLLSIKEVSKEHIQLSTKPSLERGLPMIHDFSILQKYLLSEIYSYHSVSLRRLCDNLGVSLSMVDSEVQFLENCGLIRAKGLDRNIFEIPTHLVHPVGYELKKEGVLYEGQQL